MKKTLIALLFSIVSVLTLCAFTVSQNTTLRNEEYGHALFLYPDGSCVITTSDGDRGTGKYDLNNGNIYITWDNGASQQGSYTWDRGVTSVYIEGVRYSVGRRVVPRR